MLISAIFLSWLTYLYFPISYDLRLGQPGPLKAAVVAVSLLRFFVMSLAVREKWVCAKAHE